MAAQPSFETKPLIYIVRQNYIDADTVEVHILGERFGAVQGTGTVDITPEAFTDVPTINSWSDTKIVCTVDFVPSGTRDVLGQGVVRVTTDDGQVVVQSNKQADLYGKKSNPPYSLADSVIVDDILHLNGTAMDSIEAVVLTEDVTGDEFVGVEVDKTPSQYCVKLPESANGFDGCFIIARNGTSVESRLAEDIDQNTTGPGYVWQAALQFIDIAAGKGFTVSNVPSGLTTAKITGNTGDIVYKTIQPYAANNANSLTKEAYYTNPAETEVLIRWDETVLFEPTAPTEPWQKVELLDGVNAPIVLTPQGGDVWEFAPTLTSITEDVDNYYINGTQLGGAWAIIFRDGAGTNTVAIHTGYAFGQNSVITEFTDTQVKVPKTFLANNWSQPLPVTIDRMMVVSVQNTTLYLDDVTGSWTINP